jgi:hypothetical protein
MHLGDTLLGFKILEFQVVRCCLRGVLRSCTLSQSTEERWAVACGNARKTSGKTLGEY